MDKKQSAISALSNLTEIVLPTDFPRSQKTVESQVTVSVSDSTSKAILKLLLLVDSTPFAVLLAAFAVLLMKYTAEEDIAIGSSSPSFNPLVLRLLLCSNDTLLDVIKKVTDAELHALENELPFAELLDALFPNTDTYPSLFKCRFFNLTDTNTDTFMTSSSCDITCFISQEPTLKRILPIQIKLLYNSVLFSHQRMIDMMDQWTLLIETAAAQPELCIGKISLLTNYAKQLLPDPTIDLHWNDFEGPISTIFSRNASLFPSRVCIVENSTRTFTYQHIHHASNVFAQYLISNGIKNEDVIVLYSYRGVDLVVAIMGVLKAGATFSVIDPAYPSARQIVYLSVAKPVGLVILRKAGLLSEEVQAYIKENLKIKCHIPSLEICDDGTLSGDEANSIFKSIDPSCTPSVILGPDSIATLSFTSGSTGIPKGVRGRHFSLVHFYPWMTQEFGLSSKEKFTMLSGIAHDPIQRDIFTPLYLGAELHIPTADDIGSPGQLAEWMAKHEITVTHLTPAMGQLLSANASHPIPSLKNAFFVGDVLTKRDVSRLQHLAQNTNVINMYGTTETQRAVSFLKIPPASTNPSFLSEQKDIMPAGKGMIDVQLLVINKEGLLCGIGEVGEIFVRSSGLAEGYLCLDEVTASKFLPNAFNSEMSLKCEAMPYYLGPRDRMYRTGDLGRYKPDGCVECTGRSDDQIKIRGFRIELGEIDTHLSQHPLIRENVTLVKRDKYEEQTLVSYFVPLKEGQEASTLVKDIRNYLKSKLPIYAIPAVFVPLIRMPLTPNGKVDKNALPFPDTALLSLLLSEKDSSLELVTPVQKSLISIWASLLKISASSIRLSDSFFELGGHSILATRLVFELRKSFAMDIPLGIVYREPNLQGMAQEIEAILGGDLNLAGKAIVSSSDDNLSPNDIESKPKLAKLSEIFNYRSEVDLLDSMIPKVNLALEFPKHSNINFFVTGVTGFLGAFILSSLLKRFPDAAIYSLVRAKDEDSAFNRVKNNLERHLIWNDAWSSRCKMVCGDLSSPSLGMDKDTWNSMAKNIDIIIHNGALVHWIYPYEKLKAPNVLGTIEALRLSLEGGKTKPFHFVSSTSVLDTEHYVNFLNLGKAVSEDDNLDGSSTGLQSGYGQSKWVAEKLIMRAQSRGVPATIIRPGYIVGDSKSGVCNTDDFLWRLVKGCIELGKIPRIANAINMCPVDYVSDAIVEIAAHENSIKKNVFHIWNSQGFSFDDLFSHLVRLGYPVEATEYIHWRTSLMDFTISVADNALYPLLHFVLDDLPSSTKCPELDDSNTREVVARSRGNVKCEHVNSLIPLYLGYLVEVGFLEMPPLEKLPRLHEWNKIKGNIISRSSN